MPDDVKTTERVAQFVQETRSEDLPQGVRDAATRCFVNWMGCALGGSPHPAVGIAREMTAEFGGPPAASLVGSGGRADALSAAFVNCLASAAHAFDDTHLSTVIHPTGPAASALLALAERSPPLSGEDFQAALALGIEVTCQVGVALLLPPAEGELGWYMTGVTGNLGAAAAAARVLGLPHDQVCWALALAGNQASGLRQTHGSMCTGFVPAHAARGGLQAALLAERGFTGSMSSIEGPGGLAQVFSRSANLSSLERNLGSAWEILANAYKPYPCGIVIHPVIDACLALAGESALAPARIARIDIEVNPLCLTLCDRREPEGEQDAQVSVQHWAAAALLRGRAGLDEASTESVRAVDIAALRQRVNASPDPELARDAARVTITLTDGTTRRELVAHATGSRDRPMSDEALAGKFRAQAEGVLGSSRARALLGRCQDLPALADVSELGPLACPD